MSLSKSVNNPPSIGSRKFTELSTGWYLVLQTEGIEGIARVDSFRARVIANGWLFAAKVISGLNNPSITSEAGVINFICDGGPFTLAGWKHAIRWGSNVFNQRMLISK